MIAPWISTCLWGLSSHISQGLGPYIPSFNLTRGGGLYKLICRVCARMVNINQQAAPCFAFQRPDSVRHKSILGFLPFKPHPVIGVGGHGPGIVRLDRAHAFGLEQIRHELICNTAQLTIVVSSVDFLAAWSYTHEDV